MARPGSAAKHRDSGRQGSCTILRLRASSFEIFLREFGPFVSTSGMFLPTGEVLPPGTEVELDVRAGEDWVLVQGQGRVVWVRHAGEDPDRPAGLGIEFTRIDGQSAKLVRWIVKDRRADGEDRFSLKNPASARGSVPREVVLELRRPIEPKGVTRKPASASSARGGRSGTPRLAAMVLAILGLGTLGWWLLGRLPAGPPAEPAAAREERARLPEPAADSEEAAIAEEQPVTAAQAAEQTATPPQPESGGEGGSIGAPEEIRPAAAAAVAGQVPAAPENNAKPAAGAEAEAPVMVREGPQAAESSPTDEQASSPAARAASALEAWAAAWSEQRAEDYLAAYSSRFKPPDGLSLEDWRQLRRERVAAPEFIQVTLSQLEVELVKPDRARVRVRQSYRSDTYRDEVAKEFLLVLQRGDWKILEERVVEP